MDVLGRPSHVLLSPMMHQSRRLLPVVQVPAMEPGWSRQIQPRKMVKDRFEPCVPFTVLQQE